MSVRPFDRIGSVGVSDAAATALATALRGMTFRAGGGKVADRSFQLKAVLDEFPATDVPLDTPCVSLTRVSGTADDDFDATIDEATADDTLDAAIASTESSGVLALDFWASGPSGKIERKAFEAGLPALFRSQGNARSIVLPLAAEAVPPAWHGKYVAVARFTLADMPADMDDPLSAERQEWRSMTRIEWDAEVVTAVDAARMNVIALGGPGLLEGSLQKT